MSSSPVATAPVVAARNRSQPNPRPPAPLVATARRAMGEPGGRVALLGAGCAAVALGAMFRANILHFLTVWSTDENYSHGFLVPFIALHFANEAARRGPIAGGGGVGAGVGLIAAAILGRLATVVVPVGIVGDLSLLLGLAGVVSLVFGREALRRSAFAIGFLAFMIPLPIALYAKIASPLQLGVSRVATAVLNLSGIPALCEGNVITLPGDATMFVAEACSGMRQLTGFLALTTAWAYLAARPAWHRAFLIGLSIPIAMVANVVRVALTGAITYHVDARYASGAYHTAEGMLMMGFGLALLYVVGWTLDRLAGVVAAGPRGEVAP